MDKHMKETMENNEFYLNEVLDLFEDLKQHSNEDNVYMYNQTLKQIKKDIDKMEYL